MIRLAIIGTGGHSLTFHGEPCAGFAGRIDRAAVCSLDPAEARAYAERAGFRAWFTDLAQMLEQVRPDALMVVTPVAVNFPMAQRLIPLRIPLLLEKPPGSTAAEAAELVRLAEQHQTSVTVSFNRIFTPPLQQMLHWLQARPALRGNGHLRATMLRANRTEPEFINATAIHALDVILALLGEPRAAQAQPPATGGALQTQLTFCGGATGSFLLHPVSGCDEETYELIGPDCYARADLMRGSFRAWERGKSVADYQLPADASPGEKAGAPQEIENFLVTVETGRKPAPDLRHGWAVMHLADYLCAAQSGRTAEFRPVTQG